MPSFRTITLLTFHMEISTTANELKQDMVHTALYKNVDYGLSNCVKDNESD